MRKTPTPVAPAKASATLKKSAAQIQSSIAKASAPAPKKAKAPAFKIPSSLAVCADLLYTTQQTRFAMQKEVDALQARETALREHLINTLPKSDATGVSGKIAHACVDTKTVVQVKDWDKFYKNLIKEYAKEGLAAFTLLQKRVGDAAVKERWEAGKKVPGVEPFNVPVVSITKI